MSFEVSRRESLKKFGALAIGSTLVSTTARAANGRKKVTVKNETSNYSHEYEIRMNTTDVNVLNKESNDDVYYHSGSTYPSSEPTTQIFGSLAGGGMDAFDMPADMDAQLVYVRSRGEGRLDVTVEDEGTDSSSEGNVEVTGEDTGWWNANYAVTMADSIAGYNDIENDDYIVDSEYGSRTVGGGYIHEGGLDAYKTTGEIKQVEVQQSPNWVEIAKVQ